MGRLGFQRNGLQHSDEVVKDVLNSQIREHGNSRGNYSDVAGYPETCAVFVNVVSMVIALGYQMMTTALQRTGVRCTFKQVANSLRDVDPEAAAARKCNKLASNEYIPPI